MKGVLVEEWTTFDKLQVKDLEEPTLSDNQVKIKVKATGISFAMNLFVQGKYQVRPPLPFIPGTEIAGEIIELGSATTRFKKGDRICAVIDYGGLAEIAVAKEVNVYGIPDGLSYERAISFTNSYATSFAALGWPGLLNLKQSEWILIHGASGGVGLAAIEIAKILGGQVIATAGSSKKLEIARSRGADHVVNNRNNGFRDKIMEITSSEGVNAVYDPIGGEGFNESLRCLAPEGRIMPVGFASGAIPQIAANLLLVKNLTVCGLNMGLYFGWGPRDMRYHYEEKMRKHMETLFNWFQEGLINPTISNCYSLANFQKAMEEVLSRRSFGRIAVVMD